jgi:hypothetical protein
MEAVICVVCGAAVVTPHNVSHYGRSVAVSVSAAQKFCTEAIHRRSLSGVSTSASMEVDFNDLYSFDQNDHRTGFI